MRKIICSVKECEYYRYKERNGRWGETQCGLEDITFLTSDECDEEDQHMYLFCQEFKLNQSLLNMYREYDFGFECDDHEHEFLRSVKSFKELNLGERIVTCPVNLCKYNKRGQLCGRTSGVELESMESIIGDDDEAILTCFNYKAKRKMDEMG